MTARAAATTVRPSSSKIVWILRHGQATHNPRAEAARAAGCSYDDFIELMRQDDSLDSELTEIGRKQAKSVQQRYHHLWNSTESSSSSSPTFPAIDLVVASPLSRAIQTADLALPPTMVANRICCEAFREISGCMYNAKRRSQTELRNKFPHWDFDQLPTDNDSFWQADELETNQSCKERALDGFHWLLERPETHILVVTHGGLLWQSLARYPEYITVTKDQGEILEVGESGTSSVQAPISPRFENCEVRGYRLSADAEKKDGVLLAELTIPIDERVQESRL